MLCSKVLGKGDILDKINIRYLSPISLNQRKCPSHCIDTILFMFVWNAYAFISHEKT